MRKSKSPNFVTTKPFANYFWKYKTQFVRLYIFQNNQFFNFHLREAFKAQKNVLDTLASWMETKTNLIIFLILNNFMFLPLYVNVVTISKDFNLIFQYFVQNYPLNQYYRDHQFCHFSTAKIPSWYMAFIRKMVFQRKSNVSPINLWNKILGQLKLRAFTTENIYGTRLINDLWTCSCYDEYKGDLRQHLKLWRKFAPFPPV